MMAAKILLQNSDFHLSLFQGKMADLHQRSETVVTGGGSSYYTTINSATNTFTQIFLTDEQGNEYTFGTENWDIPMRVGNDLKVITLGKAGWASSKIILAKNISLNQVSWSFERLKSELKRIYFPCLKYGLIALFVVPFALFFVLFVFFEPEPNDLLTTIVALLMGMCQLGSLVSILYGYHFRWRKAYWQINTILADDFLPD